MRKVLIITYYWPPAGGPGVQRWLKFVKYLREYSIEPIVFVPKDAHYPVQDRSLLSQVPKGIRVVTHPILEPYLWASLLSGKKAKRISSGLIPEEKKQSFLDRCLLWIRGNLFIPDARRFWISPATKRVLSLLDEEDIQTVITTGPPHSVHLIGNKVRLARPVKWMADFRDPWTEIGYHKKLKLTARAKKKHIELEHQVLNNADRIVVTSRTTKEAFEQLTDRPITVITNGFDDTSEALPPDSTYFTISHIGSLLTNRNPEGLWQALAQLVEENKAFRERIKVRLVGLISEGVRESIEQWGLEAYVETVPYVPHQEVFRHQTTSQVLLLLEINSQETRGILPGKLFEYLNARRPILALGPPHWEAGEMVAAHKAGVYAVQNDSPKIKMVLLEYFEQFCAGTLDCRSVGIEQYHRRELTKRLAKLL